MAMPSHVTYLIIGAGIHGLSTAWHLAEKLEAQGKGGGRDILVVDKTAIAPVLVRNCFHRLHSDGQPAKISPGR